MDTQLVTALQTAFCSNFMLYFRSHAAHVNITGRNFYSDHKLLGKIYEDAQTNIDVYAELLRSCHAYMPSSLDAIAECSMIANSIDISSAEEYLEAIYEDIETMIHCLQELATAARECDCGEIANFADSRIEQHRKQCWQLRVTIGEEE